MNSEQKIKRPIATWLKMGVLFTLIVGLFVGVLGSNTERVLADDEDNYSLYHRASEIAKGFDADEGPSSENEGSVWLSEGPIAGNAGGLLGYTNESTNWITSTFSANSTSYSYSQLSELGGGGDITVNPLLAYATYGSELVNMGLISSNDSGIGNTLLGWIFSIAYWFAQIVPAVFRLLLNMLTILNPFQLFFGAIDGLQAVNIPMVNDVASIVSGVYTVIQNLALTVAVPVLIALTVVSIFMFKGSAGKKVLRVVVKVFMIFAGIPLIGATYTSIIDGMADGMEMGTPFADYVVMTQFVDSEGWMKSTRLAPPTENKIRIMSGANTATGYSNPYTPTREMVFEINSTLVAGNDWMATVFDTDADMFGTVDTSSVVANNSGQDTLNRFRTGERFSAADYEGHVKAQLNNLDSSVVSSMFELSSNDLLDHSDLFTSADAFDELGRTIYNAGGLSVVSEHASVYTFTSESSGTDGRNALPASTDTAMTSPTGLSPIAMYNFLNTEFGETSMTVYSPETSASAWSSNDYASVVKVDTGFTGILYTLESMVVILASSIIGLVYAFGLFKIVMASLPRILAGVFGTAVGSMAMITKLLVSTVVLLIELIGTMLLYTIFDTLLLGVFRGADNLVLGLSGVPAFLNTAFGLKQIVIIIMSAAITFFAIKNRVAFGKMVEETTTDIITKLMGGLDNSLNQGNMFGGSDIQGSAAQGKVLGDDGNVGTKGSGQYAAAVAGGQDPDAETKGVKDALNETLGQERARELAAEASGEEFVPKTKKELAAEAMSRTKGYKVSGAKDKVVGSMGGLATAATMMGVSDLDGGARQRIAEEEAFERKAISDDARGIGYGGQSKGDGLTRHVDNEHATEDLEHQANREASDNKTPVEIAKEMEGIDSEEIAVEGSGVVSANDEKFKEVSNATQVDPESDTYISSDSDAAEALEKPFGEDASTIDLDDPTKHPDHDPLSQEGVDYIQDLDNASQAQMNNAEEHMDAAKKEDAAKDAKRNEAEKIRSKPELTEADIEKADGLLAEADEHQRKAEEHKKKARSSIRKAQKLDAKQDDAKRAQNKAIKNPSEHQSKTATSARKFAEKEQELRQLTKERASLDQELSELSESGNDPERLGVVNKKLQSVNDKIDKTSKELPELRDEAVNNLPVDNGVDESKMSPQQKASYKQARTEAARTVGQMAMQTGSNAEETVGKQREFVNKAGQQRYASKIASAEQEVASAGEQEMETYRQYNEAQNDPSVGQHQVNKLHQKHQAAKQKADTAVNNLKDVKSQETAFKRSLRLAGSANEAHFGRQKQFANKAREVQRATAPHVDERNKAVQSHNNSGLLQPGNGRDIHNKNALKMKKERLSQLGVTSSDTETARKQYDTQVQSAKADYEQSEARVNKLTSQVNAAKQSNNMAGARQIERRLNQAKQKRDNAKRTRDMRLHQLRSNASGLYAGKDGSGNFKVKNQVARRFMRGGNGAIVGDVDKVVNVASELELLQREYAVMSKKYDVGNLKNLDPKTRRTVLRLNASMESKRKLLGNSQINADLLRDAKTTHTFVDALRSEWTSVKDGNPNT